MPRLVMWLWAAPITLIGLLLAAAIRLSGGQVSHRNIAIEACGGYAPRLLWLMNPWMRIEAITLGHVIIARDDATAARMHARTGTRAPVSALGGFFSVRVCREQCFRGAARRVSLSRQRV